MRLTHPPAATWDQTVAAAKYIVLNQATTMIGIAQRLLGGTWYHDGEPFGRWMRNVHGLVPLAGTPPVLEVDLEIAATAHVRR